MLALDSSVTNEFVIGNLMKLLEIKGQVLNSCRFVYNILLEDVTVVIFCLINLQEIHFV